MALVKYAGGIAQMAGSLAGNVFSKNRYGNYVKSKTVPINPNTARQQIIRAALATLTTRWAQTLTPAQRAEWALYASNLIMTNRLGEAMHLSGYNHYIRSNTWRLDLGQAVIDDGPSVFELPAQDPTFVATCSEAAAEISITFDDTAAWCSEDNAGIMLLQGLPQNAQRNFFGGPFRGRSAKMGALGIPITSPQEFAWIIPCVEGQRVWIQARILRADGRLSEPFRDDFITAA